MKNLILISFVIFCLDTFCQNKKPIPYPDTLILDAALNTFEANVLFNDIDPEGNAKKCTSFKIGATSYTINQVVYLAGKGLFSIRTDGSVIWCPYYSWTGTIDFSYIVNDYFTGNGVRGFGQLKSVYVCDYRDLNNKCLHAENHDIP